MKWKSTGGAHNQSYRNSHDAAIPKVGPLVSSATAYVVSLRPLLLRLSSWCGSLLYWAPRLAAY